MRCLSFIIFSLDLVFSLYVVSESMVTHTTFMRPRDCKPRRKEAVNFFWVALLLKSGSYLPVVKGRQYDIRKIGLD